MKLVNSQKTLVFTADSTRRSINNAKLNKSELPSFVRVIQTRTIKGRAGNEEV
jgi:hypothetical protein